MYGNGTLLVKKDALRIAHAHERMSPIWNKIGVCLTGLEQRHGNRIRKPSRANTTANMYHAEHMPLPLPASPIRQTAGETAPGSGGELGPFRLEFPHHRLAKRLRAL
jgi:hypothetical protein